MAVGSHDPSHGSGKPRTHGHEHHGCSAHSHGVGGETDHATAIDPVWEMKVDPHTAMHKAEFGGRT